jgi:hypothetical protein
MSAGDWKDLYQAALAGNLPLVQHHISEGVNPNYQHPEVLCTPLVASLIHGHMDVAPSPAGPRRRPEPAV